MQGQQLQRKKGQGGGPMQGTPASAQAGSAVQLRGLSYDEQVQALTPEAGPQDGAPIQMRGDRGGTMIPEYDFKSMKVHSITYDKFDIYVDVSVTVKNGKDVLTVDLEGQASKDQSPKDAMIKVVSEFEEKLSARGKKRLVKALVRAFKKHGKAEKDDEGDYE